MEKDLVESRGWNGAVVLKIMMIEEVTLDYIQEH